eukprot:scaffold11117_cov20-Tisochrysis_lutea.AAC.1
MQNTYSTHHSPPCVSACATESAACAATQDGKCKAAHTAHTFLFFGCQPARQRAPPVQPHRRGGSRCKIQAGDLPWGRGSGT